LDAVNGWRGCLSGPGVAAIGVAAIAACHGPTALLAHPGLARLRGPRSETKTPSGQEPATLGSGDRMPT
jgi:hypothetical protein